MKARTKVALGILVALAVAAAAYGSVDAREIGRSDPKRAAYYRPPWFNFSETYADGAVLGIPMGSSKVDAIRGAEAAGFAVSTSGWGDNRAGQGDLYERRVLLATMIRQPQLSFYDPADLSRGMTIRFAGDRVTSIRVYYVNFEAI